MNKKYHTYIFSQLICLFISTNIFAGQQNLLFTSPNNPAATEKRTFKFETDQSRVFRSRLARLNLNKLLKSGRLGAKGTITLNLFDDVITKVNTISLIERSPSNFTWRGGIDDGSGTPQLVLLTINEKYVSGDIYYSGRWFKINSEGKGLVSINQMKIKGNTINDVVNLPYFPSETNESDNVTAKPEYISTESIMNISSKIQNNFIAQFNTSTIDIKFVISTCLFYTGSNNLDCGDLLPFNPYPPGYFNDQFDAMNNEMDQYVNYLNVVFESAGLIRRAVKSNVEITRRDEAGIASADLLWAKDNITKEGSADLVVYFTKNMENTLCGSAYMNGLNTAGTTGSRGYSVVKWGCGSRTVAYEIGHNMGAGHHVDNGGGHVFPYAYGYRMDYKSRPTHADLLSVMTYATGSTKCTTSYWWDDVCILVAGMSNPTVKFFGNKAFGINNKIDNARVLREMEDIVGNYSQ